MSWVEHELEGRPLFVWAPHDRSRSYPTVYVLHAHMRSARWWFNVEPFEVSYPDRIEQMAPDAVVVLVDGWTELGGGQWIGALGTYLRDEVVPFVDASYPCNGVRGLQGKSSGGYGAVVHCLERPDLFHAFAAHAPDALFEVTIAHGFPAVARALRGSSLAAVLASLDGLSSHEDALVVEVAAAARAFGDGTLPFDALGRPDERFEAWLQHDPVRLASRHADAVRSLRGAWLDAGNRDEYFLDAGALALRDALLAAGLPDERLRFELFDGGHGGMSGRYPASLEWLVGCLSITL
ncbi:MAG TPA: alpha/beta hydrolase-fold protein [Gaiellaceae bacterium]